MSQFLKRRMSVTSKRGVWFATANNIDKLWHMYVVECADSTLYTGITTDIERRLNEHNTTTKAAKYTRSRRPVKLVYHETFTGRSEASKAEAKFKKLKRKAKLDIINRHRW